MSSRARDSVRVAPVGELDIATVDKLRAEVDRLRESGFTKLVLDLRGVRFLDSTGLRLVLELDAAAKRPRRSCASSAALPSCSGSSRSRRCPSA